MGVWGPGNFDGDSSRDFLADMVGRWEQLIDMVLANQAPDEAAPLEFKPGLDLGENCLIPTVEIICAVAENLPCDYLPSREKVVQWAEHYLGLYDGQIDGCNPSTGYKEKRRQVIAETFARLLRLVESRSEGLGTSA
jgi:hypothetical protein